MIWCKQQTTENNELEQQRRNKERVPCLARSFPELSFWPEPGAREHGKFSLSPGQPGAQLWPRAQMTGEEPVLEQTASTLWDRGTAFPRKEHQHFFKVRKIALTLCFVLNLNSHKEKVNANASGAHGFPINRSNKLHKLSRAS